MSSIARKSVRLRLDEIGYESLRQLVLHRDGWRFQSCGMMANLEVHERHSRGHGGDDSEENWRRHCHIWNTKVARHIVQLGLEI